MFSDTLKHLRKRDGYSQAQLAQKLGVSKSTIGNYEVGTRMPDYEMMKSISALFNVSMDYLYDREEKVPVTVSDEDIKVALFGGDTEVTDEMWSKVMDYVEFVKQKHGKT